MEETAGAEIHERGGAAIVTFKASCVSNVEEIAATSEQIKRYVGERRPAWVVFDFTGVKFFSSQVLGLLLDVRWHVQRYHGQVVVSAIDPQLHRVFRITNLDKIFRFFPNAEAAIAGMPAEPGAVS